MHIFVPPSKIVDQGQPRYVKYFILYCTILVPYCTVYVSKFTTVQCTYSVDCRVLYSLWYRSRGQMSRSVRTPLIHRLL